MATNCVFAEGRQLDLTVASGVLANDPVLVGTAMTGVAVTDRDTTSGKAVVDFGGVYDLSCKGVNDTGNSAIALGDALYYVDADSPKISKKASGFFYGYALETVGSGSTDTINVQNLHGGAPGQLDVPPLTSADQALLVRNETGGNLVAGDLVYVSGWNEAQKRFLLSKADADAAGARAAFVMSATLATATNGQAFRTYRFTGQNVGGAVGDPVYLSTTAAGWTLTAPTGADDINQIVGRVAVVSATVGEIEFDLIANNQVTIGTNELQAQAVTAAKIANNTITATQIAADTITATEIAANAIGSSELADNAVDTAAIANLAVTTAKIAALAVTAAEIANATITAAKIAADTITAAEIATGAVGAAEMADNTITGTEVANVAADNLVGGVPVLHRFVIPAGATGDVDFVLTQKTRVCEVWLVKTTAAGGGAGTIQVKNGANAITNAMTIDIADKAITRAADIDDANHEIAAAGTLRASRTRTASTDESCILYVLGVRVA